MNKDFIAGSLENIGFVAMECRYKGQWVLCFHKRRQSWEMPGGHVEPGESPLEAAKRELSEETGAKDYRIIPVWDYMNYTEEGKFHNNGRVYYVDIYGFEPLPENSEMTEIGFFGKLPENITYKRESMQDTMERALRYSRAYFE